MPAWPSGTCRLQSAQHVERGTLLPVTVGKVGNSKSHVLGLVNRVSLSLPCKVKREQTLPVGDRVYTEKNPQGYLGLGGVQTLKMEEEEGGRLGRGG